MKILLSFLLGFLLIPNADVRGETLDNEIPAAIRKALDKKFPDWKFPAVSVEIRQATKEYAQFKQLNLVRGDFDGNGQLDYAMQIEQGDLLNDKGEKIGFKLHLVAFLKKENGYKYHLVDADGGGGDYLLLWKRGDKLYNYETKNKFTLKNDAFETVIFEKAGTSYVFQKGKFRAIITGD